jgi:FtsZ-interacting cell division protein YlmF
VPEQNKKLAGFEALYEIDKEKRGQKSGAPSADLQEPSDTSQPQPRSKTKTSKERKKVGNKVSKSESNITQSTTIEFFEPTTFKADRRKVLALKRLALDLTPARKLQDLFDEALADILAKYERGTE